MGSLEILRLGYRCGFAFIGTSGESNQEAIHEKRAEMRK